MNRLTRGKALVGALHIDAQDITVTDDLTVGDDATITGDATVGTLRVGAGTTIKKITVGTGAIDFGSINDGATGTGTITVTGAATGDIVIVNPPSLTAGLAFAGAAVTAANTVTVYLVNSSGGAIDEAEKTFSYLWVDAT